MLDFTVIITLNDGDEIVRDIQADSAVEAVALGWEESVGLQVADVFIES